MKSVNQNIIEKFNDLLGEEKVKVDEPMKRHTTFRIGGPADYFLLPSSEEELSGILKICKMKNCHISFLEMEVIFW